MSQSEEATSLEVKEAESVGTLSGNHEEPLQVKMARCAETLCDEDTEPLEMAATKNLGTSPDNHEQPLETTGSKSLGILGGNSEKPFEMTGVKDFGTTRDIHGEPSDKTSGTKCVGTTSGNNEGKFERIVAENNGTPRSNHEQLFEMTETKNIRTRGRNQEETFYKLGSKYLGTSLGNNEEQSKMTHVESVGTLLGNYEQPFETTEGKCMGTPEINYEQPFCRYCTGTESPCNLLVAPCDCRGSLQHVHQRCLRSWLRRCGSSTCEICCYRFRWRRRSRDVDVIDITRAVWKVFWRYLKICIPRGPHLMHNYGSNFALSAYVILSLPLFHFLISRWWNMDVQGENWVECLKYAAIVLAPTILFAMYFISVIVDLHAFILPAVIGKCSLECVVITVFIIWAAAVTFLRITLLPEPQLRRQVVENEQVDVAASSEGILPREEAQRVQVAMYLPLDASTLANCLLGSVVHCLLIHVPLVLLSLSKSLQIVLTTRFFRWEVKTNTTNINARRIPVIRSLGNDA